MVNAVTKFRKFAKWELVSDVCVSCADITIEIFLIGKLSEWPNYVWQFKFKTNLQSNSHFQFSEICPRIFKVEVCVLH